MARRLDFISQCTGLGRHRRHSQVKPPSSHAFLRYMNNLTMTNSAEKDLNPPAQTKGQLTQVCRNYMVRQAQKYINTRLLDILPRGVEQMDWSAY